MGIKRVIATILNIMDGKPADNMSYLQEAFQYRTDIQGGVVNTKVIAAQRADGTISSYQNGLQSNPIAFAAGVQNFGTAGEMRKAEISHDGRVKFTEGLIGGFYIFPDRLSSSPTGTGKRHDIVSSTAGNAYDEWYDENNILVAREGFIEGKQQKVWYDVNGSKTAAIGQNGVVSYVIPESFTLSKMGKLSIINVPNTPTLSQAQIQQITESLRGYFSNVRNQIYRFSFPVSNFYYYSAGTNSLSDSNRVYEGYKLTQNKTDNIPDGWYLMDMAIDYTAYQRYNNNEYFVRLYMIYVTGGKEKSSSATLLEVTVAGGNV